MEFCRALWSEFSKWQLKQRRGTAVLSILSSQTKDRGGTDTTEPQHNTQSSENVTKSEPTAAPEARAPFAASIPSEEDRGFFFSKGLCSAVTENITFLLQYFPIFHFTKCLNAQERPPRVKTTVAGAVLLPVSLLAVVVLPCIFSSALSTSQLLLLLSKSGEGKIQHQTMLMQIQLHL